MWQPIETAPRNQTFLAVLKCAEEQTICTMRWTVAEAKNSRPDNKMFYVERVTHWMPLPELPGAQPAQPAPEGWLRAIDEALVTAHIGVANAHDTYEQAKTKLDNLIGWYTDVAIDPAVNGGYSTGGQIMIQLTDTNGRTRAIHPNAIARLVEPGTSGKWHGVNCYVRTFDGDTIEARETVSEIMRMLEAPKTKPAPR